MSDMIVDLYQIPSSAEIEQELLKNGIQIKKALAPDMSRIVAAAQECGEPQYADEIRCAFANNPVTCYVAVQEGKILGFACYEVTAKDFFGPTAVQKEARKKGIGKALLLKSLESMREMGYAYAIIGWPADSAISFYEKCVNGVMLKENHGGVYKRMVK